MPPAPTDELALTRVIGGQAQARPSDHEIGLLARRQYGVVSRAQLIDLGLGEDAIDSRLAAGRLHRLHRGVYAVGPGVVPRKGRWLAAVLRVGEEAALSHTSAANLWGIKRETHRARIDVTAPGLTRSPPGVQRHYLQLAPDELTERHGIRVTTLARTIFDLAAEASAEGLESAIREAEYLHSFQLTLLEDLLERHPGWRGTGVLKTCLRRLGRGPRGRTRSRLEARFAAFLASTDLPKPTLNALLDLDGFKVEADCLWRDRRLIVELDGSRAHGTRAAFESDRKRDRRLQVAGWTVIRVTWRQLDDPASLLADLRRLLGEVAVARHMSGQQQAL